LAWLRSRTVSSAAAGPVIRAVEMFQEALAPNIKAGNIIREGADVLGLMLHGFAPPLLLDVEWSPGVHPPGRFSFRRWRFRARG
jgi:hypothetical protein